MKEVTKFQTKDGKLWDGKEAKPGIKLGAHITALRLARDLNLSKLAKESGISKGLLHRIENDPSSNPSLNTLRKIANGLRITVSDLLEAI